MAQNSGNLLQGIISQIQLSQLAGISYGEIFNHKSAWCGVKHLKSYFGKAPANRWARSEQPGGDSRVAGRAARRAGRWWSCCSAGEPTGLLIWRHTWEPLLFSSRPKLKKSLYRIKLWPLTQTFFCKNQRRALAFKFPWRQDAGWLAQEVLAASSGDIWL